MLRRPDAKRGELLAWAALAAAALVVRLIDLGDRPFHHDESQDAYFSWLLAERGEYEYNPLLHPPLRFYLTAAIYKLLGDSDFTARLAPALMGVLVVASVFLLRRQLGRVAAYAAAVMLAFGPSYLYYSRFAREDIYLAAIHILLIAVAFRFISRPRRHHPALLGILIAAGFATKEAMFITAGIATPFFVAWAIQERRGRIARPQLLPALRSPGGESWGWALAGFLAVYTLLFTTFLTDPHHWDGLWEGLKYWYEQHGPGRGEKEWYFYSVVLAGHEWPALVLGAIGGGLAYRARHPLGLFLIWAFLAQLFAYSYANERFTWLVLHPLLPLTLLAGIGVQAIWERRGTPRGNAGLALVAVCAAYVGLASYYANIAHRVDPREFLVTTQSSEDVPDIADAVIAESARIRREEKRQASVTIDSSEGATFPYAWYLRDLKGVGYPVLTSQNSPPTSDIVVMTEPNKIRLEPQLGGYRLRKFRFRVWWVRDYGEMTLPRFVDWTLTRDTWNPTGGMPEWLAIKGRP